MTTRKTQKTTYRQGDVLLVRVTSAKTGAEVPRENGRVILAHGEATGHAHAIRSRDVALFDLPIDRSPDGDAAWAQVERILVVDKPAQLRHDEHRTIKLEPGTYRVLRQREYDEGAVRRVAD